jgi:glycosyltransferase involved in cell wall biosynthesis
LTTDAEAQRREISDPDLFEREPLVSVCMLAFNHAPYIAEAIEGVISQRCDFPLELIVGEDCSKDGTGAIVRAYQETYPKLIRVITANRNVGMHANMRRCVDAARGSFVALCEGDDYWHNPEKLSLQIAAMTGSDELTLCHTEFDRRIGARIKRNRHLVSGSTNVASNDGYVDLLRDWTVMTATTLYRAAVVKEFFRSEFYDTRWPFADYNLALYASIKGRIVYLPVSTATWRRVPGSASNSGPKKALDMHLAATECRRRFMRAFPVSDADRLSVERNNHRKSLRLAYYALRPDIYQSSLDWLIENDKEKRRVGHALEILAMRTVVPVWISNKLRAAARSLATYSFPLPLK